MPIVPTTSVNEGSSCLISFILKDYDETAISKSSITTATMTLFDKDTQAVINTQEDIDVKDGFSAEGGTFIWELVAASNPIVDAAQGTETHIALFEIASTVGTYSISTTEEVYIKVINLHKIT